jgi:hypothetical protein
MHHDNEPVGGADHRHASGRVRYAEGRLAPSADLLQLETPDHCVTAMIVSQ